MIRVVGVRRRWRPRSFGAPPGRLRPARRPELQRAPRGGDGCDRTARHPELASRCGCAGACRRGPRPCSSSTLARAELRLRARRWRRSGCCCSPGRGRLGCARGCHAASRGWLKPAISYRGTGDVCPGDRHAVGSVSPSGVPANPSSSAGGAGDTRRDRRHARGSDLAGGRPPGSLDPAVPALGIGAVATHTGVRIRAEGAVARSPRREPWSAGLTLACSCSSARVSPIHRASAPDPRSGIETGGERRYRRADDAGAVATDDMDDGHPRCRSGDAIVLHRRSGRAVLDDARPGSRLTRPLPGRLGVRALDAVVLTLPACRPIDGLP